MGTRHLIAVQLDGQYRIAQYGQYGQFDGNPEVQGANVLDFLTSGYNPNRFKRKLLGTKWATEEWLDSLGDGWAREFPELSRKTGADILAMVYTAPVGITLRNEINFAGASLFCEWAYVIDYDKGTFEVFQGFNETPIETSERFYGTKPDPTDAAAGYEPIRCIAVWPLDALPTQEELEAGCRTPEEQEEWLERQAEEIAKEEADRIAWESEND